MKKFLIKGFVLAVLIFGPALAVCLLPLPFDHDLSAILNKRDLLKDGRRNRIIFVGGSGLYSGLDSSMIQDRLGRPVVNMGLWAGFGITRLLNEIKPYLHSGDIVVIIPEFGVIFDSYKDMGRKWFFELSPRRNFLPLYSNIPNSFKSFAADMDSLIRSKFKAIPEAVREAIRTGRFSVFTSRGYVYYDRYFNANGDSLRPLRPAPTSELIQQRGENYFSGPGYRDQSLTALNEFCRDASSRGIRTLFIFAAYPRDEYRRQEEGMKQYEQRLRKELDCEILGTSRDFLYPYAFFTDTIHHLTGQGKRMRTEAVIGLLQRVPVLSHLSNDQTPVPGPRFP